MHQTVPIQVNKFNHFYNDSTYLDAAWKLWERQRGKKVNAEKTEETEIIAKAWTDVSVVTSQLDRFTVGEQVPVWELDLYWEEWPCIKLTTP